MSKGACDLEDEPTLWKAQRARTYLDNILMGTSKPRLLSYIYSLLCTALQKGLVLSQRRESLVQRVVPARLFSGLAEIADFC